MSTRLADIAMGLVRDEPALGAPADFGRYVRQGAACGPSVFIGDSTVIELYSRRPATMLDYRMTLLAEPGDIAVVHRQSPAFEDYLANVLGVTDLTVLEARPGDQSPVALQCRTLPALRRLLEGRLREHGHLTIKSYLTTGHDWRLAQALGAATGRPVHVHGPAPRIARRANDKLWFWRQARRILGTTTVPPVVHAFGPAAASAHVARIFSSGSDAVVKVPSSAGGNGNFRLTAAMMGALGLSDLRNFIVARLSQSGWSGNYPVLVGVWERGVVKSPSAQVFIPLAKDGPPELHGLFEQRVVGRGGEFIGAVPAQISDATRSRMSANALDLANVFQMLGYFGWCSFDAILCDDGALHWIECNARWSGVSIPLTAATRMADGRPRGFAIAQETIEREGMGVEELVEKLHDLLLRRDDRREGLLLMSPPMPGPRLVFNAAAVAATQSEAEWFIAEAKSRLA